MPRFSLFALVLLILSGSASQAATPRSAPDALSSRDELTVRNAVFERVQAAIATSDFNALNAMEEDFRVSRGRTPSGIWKLALFHYALESYLGEGLQDDIGCQYRRQDFVKRWAAATPNSPAPAITEAGLLLDQAWCFRGTGYADSVKVDAWPRFTGGLAAASKTLEQSRAVASIDPEYYAIAVNVARARGLDKAAFHALVEEATDREPDYHRLYFNAVWYYLPQWGGSYAEVDQFARYAVKRSHGDERSGIYARIFWSLGECGCDIMDKAADWTVMKQSMRDIFDLYPVAWNGSWFANLACRRKDVAEGRHYFRAMHPEITDDIGFTAMFATCDAMASMPH